MTREQTDVSQFYEFLSCRFNLEVCHLCAFRYPHFYPLHVYKTRGWICWFLFWCIAVNLVRNLKCFTSSQHLRMTLDPLCFVSFLTEVSGLFPRSVALVTPVSPSLHPLPELLELEILSEFQKTKNAILNIGYSFIIKIWGWLNRQDVLWSWWWWWWLSANFSDIDNTPHSI